jgi:two-component system, NtrC family, sensor kinase
MLRPEVVALQARTSEIEELLHRSLRGDIVVTIGWPADLWPVTVDPAEFELALLNIAVNARNAMPNGGAFRLVAGDTRCRGETASGGLVGEFVAITLMDTGTGMPAEVMARAFEPYFTTRPAGRGSGLGLFPGLSLCPPKRGQRGTWQCSGPGDRDHAVSASRWCRPGDGR